MKHSVTYITIFMIVISGAAAYAMEKERVIEKVNTLESYIQEESYQRALNLIDTLHNDIYDLLVNEKKPEIDETTYINHYFKFRISNPVTEWELKQIVLNDEIQAKKTRLAKDLVKIENPQSSYGLNEQLVVSAYDVGNSTDASYVSRLEFKPELYVKTLAERLVKQNQRADSTVQKKEAFILNGYPAYRITMETDAGFDKKVMSTNIVFYVPEFKNVFILSFAIYKENHAIYMHVLDEILGTMVVGRGYATSANVEKKSFMDIYLERQQ